MNETAKALEALDRIFNYCEEIDLHIPKEEQVGYDMLVDIKIIREALENQKNIIKELEQIRAEIDALDKWGQTFYRYNLALGDCIEIIDNHIEELTGENE